MNSSVVLKIINWSNMATGAAVGLSGLAFAWSLASAGDRSLGSISSAVAALLIVGCVAAAIITASTTFARRPDRRKAEVIMVNSSVILYFVLGGCVSRWTVMEALGDLAVLAPLLPVIVVYRLWLKPLPAKVFPSEDRQSP